MTIPYYLLIDTVDILDLYRQYQDTLADVLT